MKVGIDIVEVKRFKKMKNLENFMNKYYTKNEIGYVMSKKNKYETLAGLFASKEAVLKAVGIGIGNGLALSSIEIEHNNNGAPIVKENSVIKACFKEHNIKEIAISISHTKKIAVATCIIN